MNPILVIDTETSGIDVEKHNILSIAGVLWTPGIEIKEIFNCFIKEKEILVNLDSMKINKIDLYKDLIEKGLKPNEACDYIIKSIEDNIPVKSWKEKIILAGHNVHFDIRFMRKLFSRGKKGPYFENKFFTKRNLNTYSLMYFFNICSLTNFSNCSSNDLFSKLGVDTPEESRHTALGDALATAQCFEKFYQLQKNSGTNNEKQ